MPALEIAFVAVLSFIIGSIPISRLGHRTVQAALGSESRTAATVKVLLDISKGFATVYAAVSFSTDYGLVVAIGVFMGHVCAVFPFAHGGNGLGTMLGALLALEPTLGLTALSAWTFGYYVFQQADVAVLISATSTPAVVVFLPLITPAFPLVLVSTLVFWRHRAKIRLVVFGSEKAALAQQ